MIKTIKTFFKSVFNKQKDVIVNYAIGEDGVSLQGIEGLNPIKINFQMMSLSERQNHFRLLLGYYYSRMRALNTIKNKDEIYDTILKAKGVLELYAELKSAHDTEQEAIQKAMEDAKEKEEKSKKNSIL